MRRRSRRCPPLLPKTASNAQVCGDDKKIPCISAAIYYTVVNLALLAFHVELGHLVEANTLAIIYLIALQEYLSTNERKSHKLTKI